MVGVMSSSTLVRWWPLEDVELYVGLIVKHEWQALCGQLGVAAEDAIQVGIHFWEDVQWVGDCLEALGVDAWRRM